MSLLLVDEASRVSDELYMAVRPMLAVSDGAMWLMSTPFGKRGFFYETFCDMGDRGGREWERIRVTAAECPRIKAAFLAEERAAMGERWFKQEYECEFSDTVDGVFDRDMLEQALSGEFEPLKV